MSTSAPAVIVPKDEPYSLGRAIRALVTVATEGGDFERLAPVEFRAAVDGADRHKIDSRGLFIPYDVLERAPPMDSSAGLYATHQIAPPLPPLAHDLVAAELGALVLPLDPGPVTFAGPGGGAPAAQPYAEDADVASTELTPRAVTLTPHDVAIHVPVTRRLALQSSPAVDAWARRDLGMALAATVDRLAFEGDPTMTPVIEGMWGGAADVPMADPKFPAEDDLERMEEAHIAQGAAGPRAWVVDAPIWRLARGGGRGAVESGAMSAGRHRILGWRAVPYPFQTGALVFGAMRYLTIGLWGGIDVEPVVTASDAVKGRVTLQGWATADAAMTADAAVRAVAAA